MTPTNTTEFDDRLETSIEHQKRRNKCPRYKQKVLSGAKGVNINYKDRKNSAFHIQLESYDFKLDGTRAPAAYFTNPGDNFISGQKKTVSLTRWMPLLPKDPSHGNSGALKMDADRRQILEICIVCGDKASGRHYGAISCEGCKGFFKRSIRKMLSYSCRGNKDCEVTKHHRNRCQYCRLQKCLTKGMRSDSVQSERKPLDSGEKRKSSSGLSGDAGFMDYGSSSTTNQKTFSRKDVCAPRTGVPSIIGEKSRTAALLNASAFASVVSTLATMSKCNEGRNGSASSPSPDDGDTASDEESDCGTSDLKEKTLFSRAFDTMAKAVQLQNVHKQDSNYGTDGMGFNSDQDDSNTSFEMEGSLILDNHVPFNLNAPSPMPTYLNVHYICESASRLLFLSVHWTRSIPAFQLLTAEVQIGLIRGAWCELFALGLAQCSQVMNLSTILTAIVGHLHSSVQEDKLTPARVRQITEHICKLQDYLGIMLRLQLDDHEYAYLKAIVLFSPDHLSMNNSRQVEKFQSKVTRELRLYIEQTFPDNPDRFAKLLFRLPTLRSLQSSIMEELFFAGLIGNVQIENIIPYILRMETSDYTSNIDISSSDSMDVNTGLRS